MAQLKKFICFHCHKPFLLKSTRTAHEAVCPKRPRNAPKIGE